MLLNIHHFQAKFYTAILRVERADFFFKFSYFAPPPPHSKNGSTPLR